MSHLTITGNITADPELRFSKAGNGWVTFTVAENRKDGEQESSTFQRCKAFSGKSSQLADNIAESLRKGTRVIVAGRLTTEEWEANGEKRTANVLIVDSIGADLRWATAKVARNSRDAMPTAPSPSTSSDPWANIPEPSEVPF